jgi:hypothetical protein
MQKSSGIRVVKENDLTLIKGEEVYLWEPVFLSAAMPVHLA